MSLEIESAQLNGQILGFEAVIELMHAEEKADMEPRDTDLIITPVGKRVPLPLYSMVNPRDFQIINLDLSSEEVIY